MNEKRNETTIVTDDCFVSNNETYPLCKGDGSEHCKNCCIYEDYEEYHSPYNE